jgi:hypothetical protein
MEDGIVGRLMAEKGILKMTEIGVVEKKISDLKKHIDDVVFRRGRVQGICC